MRKEHLFKVAGLMFSVSLPCGWDVEEMLPSFRPFRCGPCPEGKRTFRLIVTTQPFVDDGRRTESLGESCNDMGHVRLSCNADGYRIEMDYGGCGTHVMTTDLIFDCGLVFVRPDDPYLKTALSSMIRIFYAQAVLWQDGVSIHASCVVLKGKGYLFLGKSGTGKSTHARQWMRSFPGCILLNDDNPVLRLEDGTVVAYGTPWSGKTPCYKNDRCPVAGIVRLRQSETNRFTPLSETDTFAALLPSCSAIRHDARLQDALYVTLIRISELVPVGRMDCLPDRAAAQCSLSGLLSERKETM